MELPIDLANVGNIISSIYADVGNEGAKGPEFGKASPWGLFIVLILLFALVLMIRSMSKHLANVKKLQLPKDEKSEENEISKSKD